MTRVVFALLCLIALNASADVAINAGGPGTGEFISDRYASGGAAWRYSKYSGIYDTERYTIGGRFSYAIPVTPGEVEVTILLRESCVPCYTRSFDVTAEGRLVLANVSVAPNAAEEKVFRVTSDATLNLEFITARNEAFVNAIRVRQVSGGSEQKYPEPASNSVRQL